MVTDIKEAPQGLWLWGPSCQTAHSVVQCGVSLIGFLKLNSPAFSTSVWCIVSTRARRCTLPYRCRLELTSGSMTMKSFLPERTQCRLWSVCECIVDEVPPLDIHSSDSTRYLLKPHWRHLKSNHAKLLVIVMNNLSADILSCKGLNQWEIYCK